MARIQVVGYGSLLSEASARRSAPSLWSFRVVRVPGYVRIFNKVSRVWPARDSGADPRAVAVLAARPRPDASFLGTAFEVSVPGFDSLRDRERDYRWADIPVREANGLATNARMCVEPPDAADRPPQLWRDDVRPCPPYLDLCLDAARRLGPEVHEDFLDTTFLADGRTTLRTWLASTPEGEGR